MSNTLTQNLINMLSNPVSAYSYQLSNISSEASSVSLEDSFFCEDEDEEGNTDVAMAGPSGQGIAKDSNSTEASGSLTSGKKELFQGAQETVSLAKTFSNNVLADPNTCPIDKNSGCVDSHQRVRLEPSALESNDNGIFTLI